MAKLDLQEAYRAVPVHPSDQCLLAVTWEGTVYTDRALPVFGLRSAPKLFSALINAMMWVLHDRGVGAALHYLDDFLVLGPPASTVCEEALSCTLALCAELGFPVATEKTEGPATTITFLGIELDSMAGQVRFPEHKLTRLLSTISLWMKQSESPTSRSSCKKRDLLSLIGQLNHTASVVRPGRAFLRNLIDAASTVHDLDHWVHLNLNARADITWWHTFLQTWNASCHSHKHLLQWCQMHRGHGVVGGVCQPVVSGRMANRLGGGIYCSQGTSSHSYGPLLMGPPMGRKAGLLSLRQYGCSGSREQTVS